MIISKVDLNIIKIQLFRIYQAFPTPLHSDKANLRLHEIIGNVHLILFILVEKESDKIP